MIDEATIERYLRDANPIRDLDDVDPDELAYAVAAAHTRRAAVMQAPTQYPTPTRPVTPTPPRRRRAWVFAAAFILVVVAVGAAALVIRGDGDAPVADEPMAPIDVGSLAWSRVSHDDTVFNPTPGVDMMWSVTRGGPGFVAVGRTFSSDAPAPIPVEMDWAYWQNLGSYILGDGDLRYRGEPAVWVSEDGITWSRLSDDALPEFDRSGVMESVTAGGPGFVAVGADISPPLHPVGPPELPVSLSVQQALGEWAWNAAVWISEDGLLWSSVELP